MDYNQSNTTTQPLQSAETFLLNDIMEEKTLALRNILNDFLQVYAYRKFDTEFSNFLKHIRCLIIDGQRAGANISRMNNSSEISPIYLRASTTMSIISSDCNSIYQLPKNDYLPIEPLNPFKPSDTALLQLTSNNEIVNDDNSIESLFENAGFKIDLRLPNNGRNINSVNGSQHQNNNQSLLKNNVKKYLSKWSLNMKKSQESQSSEVALMLTGTLLAEDQNTMLEKNHDAGILECRQDNRKDLVRTKNGVYCLVGGIVNGSPNELYRTCLVIDGIPRTWRNIVKLSGVEKNTKKLMLNFSLDSPVGPLKPAKAASNFDMSINKKGIIYNKNISTAKKNTINGKKKYSEYETENSRTKHSEVHKQKFALFSTSTPKRPKYQSTMFQTPTLKNVNDSKNI